MKQVGTTPEGLRVMDGVGQLCFSNGIPLEIVLGYLKEKSMVVDWVDYIKTALLDGHNPRTIKARIDSSVSDAYDMKYAAEILSRAEIIIDWLTTPSVSSIAEK